MSWNNFTNMKTHVGLIAKTDCNSCQTQFRLNMDMHKNTSFLEISVFLIGIAQQTWGYQAEMLISARSPLISAIIIKTPRYDTLGWQSEARASRMKNKLASITKTINYQVVIWCWPCNSKTIMFEFWFCWIEKHVGFTDIGTSRIPQWPCLWSKTCPHIQEYKAAAGRASCYQPSLLCSQDELDGLQETHPWSPPLTNSIRWDWI